MKVPFEHVKKPFDQYYITPMTDGDREYPRKKRSWYPVEGKNNAMTLKRIRFEAIPEKAQHNKETLVQVLSFEHIFYRQPPGDCFWNVKSLRLIRPKQKSFYKNSANFFYFQHYEWHLNATWMTL